MTSKGRRAAVVAALLVAASACVPMGRVLEGVGLPGVRGDVLEGEVRSVDVRRDRLSIRAYDGRTRHLHVHRDTRVRYEGRAYPVSALERGDEVRVWVSLDRRGDAWADRVEVRRSVRERAVHRRAERLVGAVHKIDLRDGHFTVKPRRGPPVRVYLPPRLHPGELRYLDRLRRGDRVSVEVVPLGRKEAELVRFR